MNFLMFQVRAALVGNYKHDRLYGRGEEYGDLIVKNAYDDLLKTGEMWISKFESQSGQVVKFRLDGNSLIRQED
jgi:hypothetical protein